MDPDRVFFEIGNAMDGKLFTDHYHAKPISVEELGKLKERERKGRLSHKESLLLDEYFKFRHYANRKKEIDQKGLSPRVVYLGSGFDGLPGHAFGQENMIMTSITPKDFKPYRSEVKGTQAADKLISNFFQNPFVDNAFETVVINGLSVFDQSSVAKYANGQDSDSMVQLWREIRRICKPGASILVTDYDTGNNRFPSSALISSETRAMLDKIGWRIEQENYVEGSYCKLVATEPGMNPQ